LDGDLETRTGTVKWKEGELRIRGDDKKWYTADRLDCYLPLAVRLRVRFRVRPGKGPDRAAVEVRQLGEPPQGIRPRR
jgi:hypothetical protein